MIRRIVSLFALILVVLASSPGPASARGQEPDLTLPKGTGRLLEIKQPIGSVVVGDQSVADAKMVGPQLIYIFATGIGRTDVTVVTQDDQVAASMQVAVIPDARGAEALLRQNAPDSKLGFQIVGNRLVLRGDASDVREAQTAQRILEDAADEGHRSNEAAYAGARQITLKVRFVEVSRNEINNLGFDWSSLFTIGKTALGLSTGGAVGQAVGALASGYTLSPYATSSVGITSRRANVNTVIEALESRSLVHTIAEPNLTVRSGKTAKFRAGGDIPIPIPQQQGAVTIEYHPFGISLEFTPVLLGGGRIAVHVVPEVSEVSSENAVSFSGATVPSFTTRRVETDVELGAGQTFAIAGLFRRDVTRNRDTLPGMSDIPVLNTLMASQHYQRGETELVVLITPHLVEPMDTAAPTPADTAASAARAAALTERIGFLVD